MKTVIEARAAMLAAINAAPRNERVKLADAHGRVLGKDIIAHRDHPPFAASAMDGYALRAADAPGKLKVVGESAAGGSLGKALGKGEAARIFTGAPLPEGADAILIQEDAGRDGDWITAPVLEAGHYVRGQGIDFKSGVTLLKQGVCLDGIGMAVAASSGQGEIEVRARPRIALMANGDEIVPPGATPGPFQIFDSVSFGMTALVSEWGADATRLPSVADRIESLAAAFDDALGKFDLLVTLGGASVGDHDLVKPALARLGFDLLVDSIAVRPGKPTFFGVTPKGPVLGLPGNPASALVCAHLFLRPLIKAMLGQDNPAQEGTARLSLALPANGPREHYLRARVTAGRGGQRMVQPAESQDSSLLSIFRDADVLIRRAANAPAGAVGEDVDIIPLNRESAIFV
jgi:molybdopterin molybdotransferase